MMHAGLGIIESKNLRWHKNIVRSMEWTRWPSFQIHITYYSASKPSQACLPKTSGIEDSNNRCSSIFFKVLAKIKKNLSKGASTKDAIAKGYCKRLKQQDA